MRTATHDSAVETRLAHFEMQNLASQWAGDWHAAVAGASIEMARMVGDTPSMPAQRRTELIHMGAALLKIANELTVPAPRLGKGSGSNG